MKYPDRSIVYSRLYRIYQSIKQRCYYPQAISYKRYGAKGIVMCDGWKNDFMSFYNWAIANGYSDNLTIDRIDLNGNYEPSNCRWSTYKEQANNTSRSVRISYKGNTHTISEWADIVGINASCLRQRIIIRKWPIEKAFSTPVKKNRILREE